MNKTYILIIDSCRITTFVHRKLIQRQTSYQCKEFWHEEDALAFINSNELECILMITGFYFKTGITGLEFIEKVERSFQDSCRPINFKSVIVTSAFTEAQDDFLNTHSKSISGIYCKPLNAKNANEILNLLK